MIELDLSELHADFLAEAAEHLAELERALVALDRADIGEAAAELLRAAFRAAHSLKGNAGIFGMSELAHFTHGVETLLDALREGKVPWSRSVSTGLLHAVDALRALLAGDTSQTEDVEPLRAALLAAAAPVLPPPGVPRRAPPPPLSLPPPDELVVAFLERRPSLFPEAGADGGAVRTSTKNLERIGELATGIARTRDRLSSELGLSPSRGVREALAELGRQTRELEACVQATRTAPIAKLFGRFPRVVRDVASRLGKEALLDMEGADVEVDRDILQLLADPLTHLVRNAVDHGLESPEVREARGKSRIGRVLLRASRGPDRLVVEVVDDGGGVDLGRVRAKAVERGLLDASACPTDEELHMLVFEPGFSTASNVTDLSGRGVGMDVVRHGVERAGGAIAFTSTRGGGSRVRLELPLPRATRPPPSAVAA